MKKHLPAYLCLAVLLCIAQLHLHAEVSRQAKEALTQLLLGKDVKSLLDMPAYKEGIDIYYTPADQKKTDERGLDLKEMAKYLKEKGVGVERDEVVTITDVKVDSDRVEVHLGGGGEGRGASKHAQKAGAAYKRAGGSRINFRYRKELTDDMIRPDTFLIFMGRVVDTGKVQETLTRKEVPLAFQEAVKTHQVVEGMSYQMVLLSAGDPDQKKVDDADDTKLKETWYYMKEGHRWVVRFENGVVVKIQIY
jgi:hypothetical protein